VGYAGGHTTAPTYNSIGDHTETVQVDYDPARITYTRLLDIFWKSHQPTKGAWSKQYMNVIFYNNEQQRRLAMDSKTAVENKLGHAVKTQVLPLRSFTLAEDYHQKYILKGHKDLNKEMERIYPRHEDFVSSTAVTRLNGYAGGYGSKHQLSREIDSLGLNAGAREALTEMVRR